MKRLLSFAGVLLALILILNSCEDSKCEHSWDSGVLLNSAECGEGVTAQFTCVICGETIIGDAIAHDYQTKVMIASTCTNIGYTEYECSRCSVKCVADFVDATGHKYEDTTLTKETCTNGGTYESKCTVCGESYLYYKQELGHTWELISSDVSGTVWNCTQCHESLFIKPNESIDEYIGTEELFDVKPNFSFDIISSDDAQTIRENLKIIEYFFNNSNYEDNEEFQHCYFLESKGDNIWTVTGTSNYEYDNTYIVKLQNGVTFADYKCNQLIFTVIEDPNHENVFESQEDIVFLQEWENTKGGYYPYNLYATESGNELCLTLNKVDGLAKGMVICVGNLDDFDSITEDTECYFGKIENMHMLPDGTWLLTLSEPNLSDIFSQLDIAYNDQISFDDEDIDIEIIEDEIVSALYSNEDFIKFLSVVNISANTYFEENGYYAEEFSNVKYFMDNIQITPSVRAEGTTIYATINGFWGIPIKDGNKNEIGRFGVSFSFDLSTHFDVDVKYEIKWKWRIFPTGINYFDLRLTQTTNFGFEFGVEVDVEYSSDEDPYVQNIESGKIHRSTCPHLTGITDLSKLKGLNAVEAEEILSDNPTFECMHCRPIKGFNEDLLIINDGSSKTIHNYGCLHADDISENNKIISGEKAKYWIELGYTCCDWCHPDNRAEEKFEAIYSEMLYCSDWQQIATDISQWAKDSGASKHNQKGITLLHKDIMLGNTPLFLSLDLNFVFDFRLEASLKYKYAYTQENAYGVRVTSRGATPYSWEDSYVVENNIKLMGTVEVKAGFMIDANMYICGLSNWIRAGITAEIGLYAQLSGVYSQSMGEDQDYKAAYFEAGVYLDIAAYYKLLTMYNTLEIYSAKFPIITLGHSKAYFGYKNYCDKLTIDGSYSIDESNLLAVKYFDLKTMSVHLDKLLLSENSRYKVNITFVNGMCDIIGGKIVAKKDSPCRFKDTMIITVDCDDSWKEYNPSSSVFYLGIYEIDIDFYSGDNHTYDSDMDEFCNLCGYKRCIHKNVETLEEIPATCTETGLSEGVRCLDCGDMVVEQEILGALGHKEETIPAIKATCTESGWTEGLKCSVCQHILVEPVELPIKHHKEIIVPAIDPTCTEPGWTEGRYCDDCQTDIVERKIIDPLGHTEKVIPQTNPTCTQCGYTEGLMCSVCREILKPQDIISALGHTEVIIEAISATCTEPGWGEGKYCSYCDEVLIKPMRTDPHGHCETILEAKPATCISTGLTKGMYCCICQIILTPQDEIPLSNHSRELIPGKQETCTESGLSTGIFCVVCEEILEEQVVIPAKGHTKVTDAGYAPTCTETGLIGAARCLVCGVDIAPPEIVPALGHDEVIIEAVAPTCTQTGLTEGIRCSRCDTIIVEQTVIEKLPHNHIITVIEPTCTEKGYTTYTCKCGDTYIDDYVDALGHTEVILDAVEATCTSAGLTEGKHCLHCKAVLIQQTVIPLQPHSFGEWVVLKEPTTSEEGIKERYCHCEEKDVCVIPKRISEGLLYSLNSDGKSYSVVGIGTCTDTDIGIPNIYDDLPVTEIADWAFDSCQTITSVVVPNSVTRIGVIAFRECSSLKYVELGKSVNLIEELAFAMCGALERVVMGENVKSIGRSSFSHCTSLEDIELGDSVTSIGDSAFYDCTSLTKVEMGDLLTHIGKRAFYDCTSLENIELGDSLTSIGDEAFRNCTSLTDVKFGDSLTSIGNHAFCSCSSLANIDFGFSSTNIGDYAFWHCTSLKDINLGDSVTSIGNSAFYDCTSLTKVEMGDLLTHIGKRAFSGCSSLTDVKFGDSVTSIDNSAFYDCILLNYVTIPNSVTSIGNSAFYNCTSLKDIEIGDSVATIGNNTFSNCISLTEIVIPGSVITIGNGAFSYCASLEKIVIPDFVTDIGNGAFMYCKGLTSVNIGKAVTSIGDEAFEWCNSLTNIEIGESVINIGNGAFKDCAALVEIMIPNSVINIGAGAFSFCSSLVDLVMPNSITNIEDMMFYGCGSLKSINIPNSVITIGYRAFMGCSSLTSIDIPGDVTSIGDEAFQGCWRLTNITFKGTVEQWNTIDKGSNWENNIDVYTIYCTDGTIMQDGTVTYYTSSVQDLNSNLDKSAPVVQTTVINKPLSKCNAIILIDIWDDGKGLYIICPNNKLFSNNGVIMRK